MVLVVTGSLSIPAPAFPPLPPADTRNICGTDDIEQLDKVTDDLIHEWSRPVGMLHTVDTACTGTLISEDLFLTAGHCQDQCSKLQVTFGHLGRDGETFACKKIVEVGPNIQTDDYMVLELEGSPGVHWGWHKFRTQSVTVGTPLLIIHHPGGFPMRVSRKNCSFGGLEGDFFLHVCDTFGGSSGAAILVPDYEHPENTGIIATHTRGGCTVQGTGFNKGPTMAHLISKSPMLQAIHGK